MARSGTSFRDIAFRKAATRDSRFLAEYGSLPIYFHCRKAAILNEFFADSER